MLTSSRNEFSIWSSRFRCRSTGNANGIFVRGRKMVRINQLAEIFQVSIADATPAIVNTVTTATPMLFFEPPRQLVLVLVAIMPKFY